MYIYRERETGRGADFSLNKTDVLVFQFVLYINKNLMRGI